LFAFIKSIRFEFLRIFAGLELAVLYFCFRAAQTGFGYSIKFENRLGLARQRPLRPLARAHSMPRQTPGAAVRHFAELGATLRMPPRQALKASCQPLPFPRSFSHDTERSSLVPLPQFANCRRRIPPVSLLFAVRRLESVGHSTSLTSSFWLRRSQLLGVSPPPRRRALFCRRSTPPVISPVRRTLAGFVANQHLLINSCLLSRETTRRLLFSLKNRVAPPHRRYLR
jgi:hypothetical protein